LPQLSLHAIAFCLLPDIKPLIALREKHYGTRIALPCPLFNQPRMKNAESGWIVLSPRYQDGRYGAQRDFCHTSSRRRQRISQCDFGKESPFGDNVRTHSVASSADAKSSDASEGSKLIVGPNIQLKGVEISNCDVLSVEGHVEATVGSRTLHIAQPGTFSGQADIEIAEIQGEFTGDLTARKKLVILATGKVSGKIRYGKLVIEEGGELSGDVKTIGNANEDVSLKSPTPIAPGLAPKPILPATH
jgi:cytoskeletal protein CcmA (bactofilin family)